MGKGSFIIYFYAKIDYCAFENEIPLPHIYIVANPNTHLILL